MSYIVSPEKLPLHAALELSDDPALKLETTRVTFLGLCGGELSVDYESPTPLGEPLTGRQGIALSCGAIGMSVMQETRVLFEDYSVVSHRRVGLLRKLDGDFKRKSIERTVCRAFDHNILTVQRSTDPLEPFRDEDIKTIKALECYYRLPYRQQLDLLPQKRRAALLGERQGLPQPVALIALGHLCGVLTSKPRKP